MTYQPYVIFGIAIETGIGKTTVLNFITLVFIRKSTYLCVILLTAFFTIDVTLQSLGSDGEIGKDAQSIKEWMAYSITSEVFLGLSMVGS